MAVPLRALRSLTLSLPLRAPGRGAQRAGRGLLHVFKRAAHVAQLQEAQARPGGDLRPRPPIPDGHIRRLLRAVRPVAETLWLRHCATDDYKFRQRGSTAVAVRLRDRLRT